MRAAASSAGGATGSRRAAAYGRFFVRCSGIGWGQRGGRRDVPGPAGRPGEVVNRPVPGGARPGRDAAAEAAEGRPAASIEPDALRFEQDPLRQFR